MFFEGVSDAEREKQQESSETHPQQQHDADTTISPLTGWPWRRVSAATSPRRRRFWGRVIGTSGQCQDGIVRGIKENRTIAGAVSGINASGIRFVQSVIR